MSSFLYIRYVDIVRAYKVKLYPTKKQEVMLNEILDGCRYVYNHFLEERKKCYLKNKKTLSYLIMSRELTKLRHSSFLSSVHAEPLQQSLRRLDTSYNRFFRKQSRFPKFKSKFANHQSFQKHQSWGIEKNRIQIQTGLNVKYRGDLPEDKNYGTLIVSKLNKKWVASVTSKETISIPRKTKPIGIDVGITALATTSDGIKYPNLQPQKSLQKKLSKAQRALAHKKLGSNRRRKAKIEVANIYNKIANVRKNHIHQTTAAILKKNPSKVVVEDLNVSGMLKNRHLSRAISDASFRELLRQLKYKQEWRGGEYVEIGRFFPSSKTCHKCGFILDKLPLSKREWECPQCHTKHDRDINAAKVILKQAKEQAF